MRWVGQPGPALPPPRPVPPKRKGCLTIVGVMIGGSTLCCCLGSMLIAAGADDLQGFDPIGAIAGPEISLGSALVPESLEQGLDRAYVWRNRQRYGLRYGLSSDVHGEVDEAHAKLARRFSFQTTSTPSVFNWTPPPGCQPQPWSCVFNQTAASSAAHIAPLTALFRQQQTSASLDIRATAELVVTFVQNITYRLPTEAYFELLPPELVVADGSGDCDSKALLAAMMLKDLGVQTAMLYSRSLGHAALGVALPGTGTTFASGRTKYLFVEVTYPGWAIGTVPPQYDKPKQWEVLPLR